MSHPTLRPLTAGTLLCAALFSLSLACKQEAPTQAAPTAPTAPAAAPAPAPVAAVAAQPVDVCGLLTREEVAAVVGSEVDAPTVDQPRNSLLGGCSYMVPGKPLRMLSINARPASEYEETIKAYDALQPLAGVGERAHYAARLGMMVKPAGKPYFFHLLLMPGNDQATLTQLATAAF